MTRLKALLFIGLPLPLGSIPLRRVFPFGALRFSALLVAFKLCFFSNFGFVSSGEVEGRKALLDVVATLSSLVGLHIRSRLTEELVSVGDCTFLS